MNTFLDFCLTFDAIKSLYLWVDNAAHRINLEILRLSNQIFKSLPCVNDRRRHAQIVLQLQY